jgi:prepilin-type N-terminal cleavage/methylation domain-containing protein
MPLARPSRRRSAFTLIELLAVMAIVAILVSLSFALVRGGKERAAIARTRGDLAALTQALEAYKQHYGDYPQTGNAAQAPALIGAVVAQSQAQSLLFNALTGVYGPVSFTTRLNGPTFVELSKMRTEVALLQNTFGVPQGIPPAKLAVANAFVDAWGNRYLYYYRPAPVAGRPAVNQWRLPGFILYSAGPDGQHTPPNINTGLFTGTTQTTGVNADNLYANP